VSDLSPAQAALRNMTPDQRIGARVRAGNTRLQIAALVGTSARVVEGWERGSLPSDRFARRYMAALDLEVPE
jgi:DNA-binding transcriptional regulator YiaG